MSRRIHEEDEKNLSHVFARLRIHHSPFGLQLSGRASGGLVTRRSLGLTLIGRTRIFLSEPPVSLNEKASFAFFVLKNTITP